MISPTVYSNNWNTHLEKVLAGFTNKQLIKSTGSTITPRFGSDQRLGTPHAERILNCSLRFGFIPGQNDPKATVGINFPSANNNTGNIYELRMLFLKVCFKCGKPDHQIAQCTAADFTCYNFKQVAHITQIQK